METGWIPKLLLGLVIAVQLLGDSFCSGVPVEPYFGDNEGVADPDEAQRLFVTQQFKRQLLRNLGSDDTNFNLDENNLKRLIAQKRFGVGKQTRVGRGGVALCLWKVCPAGPWLVQK